MRREGVVVNVEVEVEVGEVGEVTVVVVGFRAILRDCAVE